jgi:hypothetical protein
VQKHERPPHIYGLKSQRRRRQRQKEEGERRKRQRGFKKMGRDNTRKEKKDTLKEHSRKTCIT